MEEPGNVSGATRLAASVCKNCMQEDMASDAVENGATSKSFMVSNSSLGFQEASKGQGCLRLRHMHHELDSKPVPVGLPGIAGVPQTEPTIAIVYGSKYMSATCIGATVHKRLPDSKGPSWPVLPCSQEHNTTS